MLYFPSPFFISPVSFYSWANSFTALFLSTTISIELIAEVPNHPAACLDELVLMLLILEGIRAAGVAKSPVLFSSVRS